MTEDGSDWKASSDVPIGATSEEVVKILLENRGISTPHDVDDFLYFSYEGHLHDPYLFSQMDQVVERVLLAKERGEVVGIFGDHDADGVCAAALLVSGLEDLGVGVHCEIPSKQDGHGLSRAAIDRFASENILLVMTVDCGSSNVDEIEYAKNKGIEVIITDHHHMPDLSPEAYAIINPQSDDSYPFKDLCGTGVVFKVLQALYEKLEPSKASTLKWYLDLVAIATVADCMPLLGENRVFVRYGLVVLEKSRRAGLQELLSVGEVGKYDSDGLSAHSIAFGVAPRLNAAGRMSHARDAFELLCEKDQALARVRAHDIEQLNTLRRSETERFMRIIEKDLKGRTSDKNFIFALHEDVPIGLVGIIAGRLTQKYGVPVGVFTSEGDVARGSFRSVPGISVVDFLTASSQYLTHYGGHAAAGGAALQAADVDDFVCAVESYLGTLDLTDVPEETHADLEISSQQVCDDLRERISVCAPFGYGNTEPKFIVRGLQIESVKNVGKTQRHAKIVFAGGDNFGSIDAIGFGLAQKITDLMAEIDSSDAGDHDPRFDVITTLDANAWNGVITTQLKLEDIRLGRTA